MSKEDNLQFCALLEFPQEEDAVEVGMAEWVEGDVSQSSIDNRTVFKVRWPYEGDTPLSGHQTKKINLTSTWKTVPAIVLALGEWSQMGTARSTYLKHGTVKSTREQRKYVAARKDVGLDLGLERDAKKGDLKRKKSAAKLSESVQQTQLAKKVLLHNPDLNKSSCDIAEVEDDIKNDLQGHIDDDCSRPRPTGTTMPKNGGLSVRYDGTMSSSDEETGYTNVPLHQRSKSSLISQISILKEENKNLRRENGQMRDTFRLFEGLPKLLATCDKVAIRLEKLDTPHRSSSASTSHSQNKRRHSSAPSHANRTSTPHSSHLPSSKKLISHSSSSSNHNHATSTSSHSSSSIHRTQAVGHNKAGPSRESSCSKSLFDDPSDDRGTTLDKMDDSLVVINNDGDADDTSTKETMEPIDPAFELIGPGVRVAKEKLLRCNTKTWTKMTCDLMSILFTSEEMCRSSLTGMATNFARTVEAKAKLDPIKVSAIVAYISKKYINDKVDEEGIHKTIKQKLNNMSKKKQASITKTVPAGDVDT